MPKVAPAKAAWDMQNPIEVILRCTTNTPTKDNPNPANIAPKIIFNNNSNGSEMISIKLIFLHVFVVFHRIS